MGALQTYDVTVDWTGADERGTASYASYSRDHEVRVEGKPTLLATSDLKVRSDVSRYRAEELFVGSVAQSQMLWFLRTAAREGVVVTSYLDRAQGTMRIESGGAGPFVQIVLRPRVEVPGDVAPDVVDRLHREAREHNHVIRSLRFPVRVEPVAHVSAAEASR